MSVYGGSCSMEQKKMLINMVKEFGKNNETELIFSALEEYALNKDHTVIKASPCEEIDFLQRKANESGLMTEQDLLSFSFSAFQK